MSKSDSDKRAPPVPDTDSSDSEPSDALSLAKGRLVALEEERVSLLLRLRRAEQKIDALHEDRTSDRVSMERLSAELERTRQDRAALREAADRRNEEATAEEIGRLTRWVDQLETSLDKLRERLVILKQEKGLAPVLFEKIEQLELEKAELEGEKLVAEDAAARTREMIAFQLGQALLQAFKSIRGFISFPRKMIGIARFARQKRRQGKPNSAAIRPAVPSPGMVRDLGPSDDGLLTNDPDRPVARLVRPHDRKLRIASIMDEFTVHAFEPECDLIQLHPKTWGGQLLDSKPDLVFIESAWHAVDGAWTQKISSPAPETKQLISWCRLLEIPVVFWNKEDPVHFGTFLKMASLADHVFTTDIDCIPKYKRALGHDRVYLLPFAAQPRQHNPIERHDRKDAANFAGSYYLRYPERQRDFDMLIETARTFVPVEIFDRNYERAHPHYAFPDQYKEMILGSLPFREIDKAYKGYRFGININTIKQSQTMFARRVFELLASNTVAISNFSRGMRLLFGKLVPSSDNGDELAREIGRYFESEADYRKLRLLGLRKVMSEHCYKHRLAYIAAKVSGVEYHADRPSVTVAAQANSEEELRHIIENFTRQNYVEKRLLLYATADGAEKVRGAYGPEVEKFSDWNNFLDAAARQMKDSDFFGLFSAADYYGPNYLADLLLAETYSDAEAFGKPSHYEAGSQGVSLAKDGAQYAPCDQLAARSAVTRPSRISANWLAEALAAPETALYEGFGMLALDEFNYCRCAVDGDVAVISDTVDDLVQVEDGVELAKSVYPLAEALGALEGSAGPVEAATDTHLAQLDARDLERLLVEPESNQILIERRGETLAVRSTLPANRHAYVWSQRPLKREECNFVLDSRFRLECKGDLALRTVFEFLDESGEKLSHSINLIGNTVSLPIPPDCRNIRFGLRIAGPGEMAISKLSFGGLNETPAVLVGRSPYLVVARQYPAYDDLYSYGFLHRRVVGYRERGVPVDVLRLRNDAIERHYHEFNGVDVATGNADLLDATLATGQHRHVLIHLLYRETWQVLKKHIDRIKVTAWVHGAEIQPFHRREFNMEGLPPKEIDRQKRLSDLRMAHWRDVVSDFPDNLHLVFVSKTFAEEAMQDIGIRIPEDKYSIIHNPIDTDLFDYRVKDPEQRRKILSIRPYHSRVYANDLAVQAILDLSQRPFFEKLEFRLVGDGPLFEETVAPLRGLANVHLQQGFLTQTAIADLYEEYGVFLAPTRMDTQGVSRDEAMSSGLVPVTTRVAAVPEFVDETCGFLADPEDAKGLADAIERLYSHPDQFEEMSRAAGKRVRGQSAANLIIPKELGLFQDD